MWIPSVLFYTPKKYMQDFLQCLCIIWCLKTQHHCFEIYRKAENTLKICFLAWISAPSWRAHIRESCIKVICIKVICLTNRKEPNLINVGTKDVKESLTLLFILGERFLSPQDFITAYFESKKGVPRIFYLKKKCL